MRRRSKKSYQNNLWPGFVDALSTLLLVLMFLLSLYSIAQYSYNYSIKLKNEKIASLDENIQNLSSQYNNLRSENEKLDNVNLNLQNSVLERDKKISDISNVIIDQDKKVKQQSSQIKELSTSQGILTREKNSLEKEIAAQKILLSQKDSSIEDLQEKFNILKSENDKNLLKITELSKNIEDLKKEQSSFFGQNQFYNKFITSINEIENINIIGDRLILESDILFSSCSDFVNEEAKSSLQSFAEKLLKFSQEVDKELDWVLQIDGHADKTKLESNSCLQKFSSNRDLSIKRAMAVAETLNEFGVADDRMVVAGYGEYKPLNQGNSLDDLRQNRRIEFKIIPK